jgi:ABC-type uncharacterized transport system permease subunit
MHCTGENHVPLIYMDVIFEKVVSLCGYLFLVALKITSSNRLVNRYVQFEIVPVYARTIRIVRDCTLRFEL